MDVDGGKVSGAIVALAGAATLFGLWQRWTGRSRHWAARGGSHGFILGLGPPAGLFLLGIGLAGLLPTPVGPALGLILAMAALALLVPGLIYVFGEPRWWGPRWYRRMAYGLAGPPARLATRTWMRLAGRRDPVDLLEEGTNQLRDWVTDTGRPPTPLTTRSGTDPAPLATPFDPPAGAAVLGARAGGDVRATLRAQPRRTDRSSGARGDSTVAGWR
jgi:hypothetical protein